MSIRINKYFSAYFSRRNIDSILKGSPRRVQVFSWVGKGACGPVIADYRHYIHDPNYKVSNGAPGMGICPKSDVVFLDGMLITGAGTRDSGECTSSHTSFSLDMDMKSQTSTDQFFQMVSEAVVIKLFKPKGIECTCNVHIPDNIVSFINWRIKQQISALRFSNSRSDGGPEADHGVNTHMELEGLMQRRLFPIGRLDKDSTGVLLLTDCGPLNQALCKPGGLSLSASNYSHRVSERSGEKVYCVWLHKAVSDRHLHVLEDGVAIRSEVNRGGTLHKVLDHHTRPCRVLRIQPPLRSGHDRHQSRNQNWSQNGRCDQSDSRDGGMRAREHCVEITLAEGRNRQVRRMFAALGYRVLGLQRVSFCGVKLSPWMREGDFAVLGSREKQILMSQYVGDNQGNI